ncbi:MAG: sulfotransferase [Candidatus Aminicenantes bacterium]|nr:MAG: sulfotransferase [Candidatus Aminicenantes bacterium]
MEEQKREEIRKTLFAVINRYNKPLLIKNLNAGQRMGLIHQVAPNARFIFIKRDPLYTAQSIWLSKQQIGLTPDQWWSIMPRNYDDLVKLEAHQQVVRQIFFLEKQVLEDRRYFPAENFVIVHYEELCRRPRETIATLQRFIGPGVKSRKSAGIPDLNFQETQKMNDRDFLLLKKEVSQWDWENYQ